MLFGLQTESSFNKKPKSASTRHWASDTFRFKDTVRRKQLFFCFSASPGFKTLKSANTLKKIWHFSYFIRMPRGFPKFCFPRLSRWHGSQKNTSYCRSWHLGFVLGSPRLMADWISLQPPKVLWVIHCGDNMTRWQEKKRSCSRKVRKLTFCCFSQKCKVLSLKYVIQHIFKSM